MDGKCVDFRLFSDTTSCAKVVRLLYRSFQSQNIFVRCRRACEEFVYSTSLKKIDSQQIFTAHCHILQIRNFFSLCRRFVTKLALPF